MAMRAPGRGFTSHVESLSRHPRGAGASPMTWA